MKPFITLIIMAGCLGTGTALYANELQSLQNMERERAALVAMYRDTALDAESRQARATSLKQRLVDLERMVLRDDRLLGHQDRLVRLAFDNYELSFLMHASAEAEVAPVEQWLGEVGLGTDDILGTTAGRR